MRVGLGEPRGDLRSALHREWLVVTGDGGVEQGLEDPELRGEQPVHGRGGHVGVLADCVDGGRHVAAFDEQPSGRVDHCSTGEARAGLTTLAVVREATGLTGLGTKR